MRVENTCFRCSFERLLVLYDSNMMAATSLIRRSFIYFNNRINVRNYLSSSYLCQDQWSQMIKQDPLISKANQGKNQLNSCRFQFTNVFFHSNQTRVTFNLYFKFILICSLFIESLLNELIQRYNSKLKVGAIDVDVFAHLINNEQQFDELEHILTLFRKTRRSVDVLDSTHHAVCRAYINFNSHDRLLPLLEKRIEYGIFPDDYIYNALMDYYLKKNNFIDAFRVASLYMLQEKYDSEITRTFALFSAYKWLTREVETSVKDETEGKDGEAKEEEEEKAREEEDEDDEEEEVKYVRVPFLRNAYNDGHFDLTDQNVICGKIFQYIGMHTKNPLGVNVQILGLSLTSDWDNIASILKKNKPSDGSSFIVKDLLDLISSKVSKEGVEGFEDNFSKLKNSIQPLTKLDVTLESLLNDAVSNIDKLEKEDNKCLTNRMTKWQEDRQYALDAHLHELARDRLIVEIRNKRKEMKKKEKLLYFFENLDKIEMELEDAERNIESASKSVVEEEYIPPTVSGSLSRN